MKKKMEKNKNTLYFRRNENIVISFETSLGENMHNINYIDNKNKVIVDVQKYEERRNEKLKYGNSNEIERNDEIVIKMGIEMFVQMKRKEIL